MEMVLCLILSAYPCTSSIDPRDFQPNGHPIYKKNQLETTERKPVLNNLELKVLVGDVIAFPQNKFGKS